MTYLNDDIIDGLKTARARRGLSQRDLSARTGVPQSHISKIESGAADLRLSSLIELARALDLELALVPRKFVPAVEGIIRSDDSRTLGPSPDKTLHKAQAAVASLVRRHPDAPELKRLEQTVRELAHLRLTRADLAMIGNAARALMKSASSPDALLKAGRIGHELRALRNEIAHGVDRRHRAAYSLDEDDDA